jgi:hypothetical protein
MKTYVVFDRKTGEILRTHVQTDDYEDATEHILKTANPEASRQADVLETEALAPGAGYRVDVKTKKLIPVEPGKTQGLGGGFVQPTSGDLRASRKSFVDARTGKKL